ncbi:MAG: hypothetical protein JNM60_07385 [Candidatus Competibacteraceae bacterium]|nr:hypothetical protein [Candidatus Competibacteraceae bacterium]
MSLYPILFVLGCGLATGLTYSVMNGRLSDAYAMVSTLEQEVSRKESELLGYTKYTSYLTVGKQSLAEQMKLLTATMVREEGVTQVIERSLLGLSSTGTVAIWYSAEYSFGFDLQSDSYDVRPIDSGIEVRVKKPALIATPAITQLRYQILSGGLFTDERGAVLRLYEEAAKKAKEQGEAMASDAAVVALCEKRLIAFLHDFLAKQPGVKIVPQISVVYQ